MLFIPQTIPTEAPAHFSHSNWQADRFLAGQDPVLQSLGGSRVDVAIGVDRTMYQLEVSLDQPKSNEVSVYWVKAETVSRRAKTRASTPLAPADVPTTFGEAIASLCKTYGLDREIVMKDGVDLLSYWERSKVSEHLEMPMSKDWKRHSLSSLHG